MDKSGKYTSELEIKNIKNIPRTLVMYIDYLFQVVVTEVESGNHFYSQFVDQGLLLAH